MTEPKPAVLVTGIAGNLGRRLIPLLAEYRVIGIDMQPPTGSHNTDHFERLDLGIESSCVRLVQIIRQFDVRTVVHLAFVIDPLKTGVLDVDRMWQINVAGTARVMEAIAEVNRQGGRVEKFIFLSSVSAYGPETSALVNEDQPLAARTLPTLYTNRNVMKWCGFEQANWATALLTYSGRIYLWAPVWTIILWAHCGARQPAKGDWRSAPVRKNNACPS